MAAHVLPARLAPLRRADRLLQHTSVPVTAAVTTAIVGRRARTRCQGVDEERSTFPGAQLRDEKLDQVTSKLEKQVEAAEALEPRCSNGSHGSSDTKMSRYRMVNLPLPRWLLLCCMLPYLLPLLDCWRFFGLALAQQLCPSLAVEWTSFLQQTMLEDILPILEFAQPLVLFAMPTIAVQRRLLQLLRFNLNQAFVIDLGVCLTFHASCFSRWLSLQRGDQIYVPLQAELPVMPGSRAILLLFGACLLYCISSTALGSYPDGIPSISVEAKKSLGSLRTHRHTR